MNPFYSFYVILKQDYLHSIHFYSFPFLYFKTSNQDYLIPFHSLFFHFFPLLKYIQFHSFSFPYSLMIISFHSLINSQMKPIENIKGETTKQQYTREATRIITFHINLKTHPEKKISDYLKQSSNHIENEVKNSFKQRTVNPFKSVLVPFLSPLRCMSKLPSLKKRV